MNSLAHGETTSEVEVTNISSHGIWILTQNKELFMAYDDFPWFKNQPDKAILRVELQSENHLYWPVLDVDLSLDSIIHPERYPLKALI